jgi:hypothetical protein
VSVYERTRSEDGRLFATLCYMFAPQIFAEWESNGEYVYDASFQHDDAPHVTAVLQVEGARAQIAFEINHPDGKWELGGRVLMNKDRDADEGIRFLIREQGFGLLAEYCTYMEEQDFDRYGEAALEDDAAFDRAYDEWERDDAARQVRLAAWMKQIDEAGVLARLAI